jgi:hypothetical protein
MMITMKLMCTCVTDNVFKHAVSIPDHIASRDRVAMNNKLDGSAGDLLRCCIPVFAPVEGIITKYIDRISALRE